MRIQTLATLLLATGLAVGCGASASVIPPADDGTGDSSPGPDSGPTPPVEAGPTPPPVDGGTGDSDQPPPPVDSGTGDCDQPPPVDSGTPKDSGGPVDSGSPKDSGGPVDSGKPGSDAGTCTDQYNCCVE